VLSTCLWCSLLSLPASVPRWCALVPSCEGTGGGNERWGGTDGCFLEREGWLLF